MLKLTYLQSSHVLLSILIKCRLFYKTYRFSEYWCALSPDKVSLLLVLQALLTHPKSPTTTAKIKGCMWTKVTAQDLELQSLHLINLSSSILHSKGTYDFKEIANQMITRYRKLDKRERNHFNTIKRFYSAIILIVKKHILIAASAGIKWQVLDSLLLKCTDPQSAFSPTRCFKVL